MYPFKPARCMRVAGIAVLWVSYQPLVHAADQSQTVISPLATMGKLAAALVIVLVVFFIFAKVMRHVQGFQGGLTQGLKIVSALSVGQRERVVVVQAGEEQLVLGVTSSQINTLHVLNKPIEVPSESGDGSDFKSKLTAAVMRQTTPK